MRQSIFNSLFFCEWCKGHNDVVHDSRPGQGEGLPLSVLKKEKNTEINEVTSTKIHVIVCQEVGN